MRTPGGRIGDGREQRQASRPRPASWWLLAVVLVASCAGPRGHVSGSPSLLDGDEGSFRFDPTSGPHPGVPIDVFYSRPVRDVADAPILIVMPGRGRNADGYRDTWSAPARRAGAVLVVPEFPADLYTTADYNLGNVVDRNGEPLPPERWTFSVVEDLFDAVVADLGSNRPRYHLYGHSAGAQFVQRLMFHLPDAPVERAAAANAGWYTMPDHAVPYPYGLGDGPITADDDELSRIVGAPLTILLGSADDDPDAQWLRRDDGAMQQGETRLERGFTFYASGQRLADTLAVDLGWELEVVSGVGHSNAAMAEPAARVLLG